jgi:hypothetical protein
MPLRGEEMGVRVSVSQGVALGFVVGPLRGEEEMVSASVSQGVALGSVVGPLRGEEETEAKGRHSLSSIQWHPLQVSTESLAYRARSAEMFIWSCSITGRADFVLL